MILEARGETLGARLEVEDIDGDKSQKPPFLFPCSLLLLDS